MTRAYLLLVAAALVPVALGYGVDPPAVLPRFMTIKVEGTDETQILRALMGLYLGMAAFSTIAAFRPDWRRVAVIWAVFFLGSLALGRLLSLVLDGMPSPIFNLYLAVELAGAALGLALLARKRR